MSSSERDVCPLFTRLGRVVPAGLSGAAAGLLLACGGGADDAPASRLNSSPAAIVESDCSAAALQNKQFFLTVRNTDSSVIGAEPTAFENIESPVTYEEVIIDGKPYLGIAVPIPAEVPAQRELQFTVLAANSGQLANCIAQVNHTLGATEPAPKVVITQFTGVAPALGISAAGGPADSAAACINGSTLALHVVHNPNEQLLTNVCHTFRRAEQTITFMYSIPPSSVMWRAVNADSVEVTQDGQVTARTVGATAVTGTYRNAHGSITVVSSGGATVPFVSASSVALVEGNDGVQAVEMTVQLTTETGAALDVPVSIDFATAGDSAQPGVDYCADEYCSSATEVTGSVNIAAGHLRSEPIRFYLNGDRVPERDDRFNLLLDAQNVAVLADRAVIAIVNDDGPSSKVFARGVGLRGSNGTGTFPLRAIQAGDAAWLVWDQKTTVPGAVTLSDERFGTRFDVRASDLVGGQGYHADGSDSNVCFIARVPDSALAATTADMTTSFRIRGADIHNGAGLIVVSDLVEQNLRPDISTGLEDIARFSDGRDGERVHHVYVKAGCDFFYHGTPDHENSRVVTFPFIPAAKRRTAKVTLFVQDADPGRGSEIVVFHGTGDTAIPARLDDRVPCTNNVPAMECVTILASDLRLYPAAFVRNNGGAWDTFGQYSGTSSESEVGVPPLHARADPDLRGVFEIPAGSQYVSLQLLSPASLARRGDSLTLMLAVLEIFPVE